MKQMKYFISIIILASFLIVTISCDNSSSKSSSSKNSNRSKSNNSSYSKKSISTCYTCGISYQIATLPYMGKYCSQNCCGAYEGLHPSCGY